MVVIQTKEFQKVYRSHVETGGLYGRMAQKAAVVITNLTNGLPPGVATSNNCETRLYNCVKYALNDSFRLVTVQDSNHCFILFMGIHDKCDEWLGRHRNMKCVLNPVDQTVGLIAAVETAESGDLTPTPLDPSEAPFLQQIPGVDWSQVIAGPALRFMLLELKESDGEDKIWKTIAVVQQENAPLADVLVSVINHLRRGQPTEARLAMEAFLGIAVAQTPERPIPPELVEAAIRQPTNSDRFVVLNDLNPEELKLLLDPLKFQDWMVYLHESQKRVVDEDFDKSAVLTGVSGSGKTCVLVHRARRLCREYPRERVLILTLNRSLARLINNLVGRICSESESSRIDVLAFHEFLANLIKALDLDSFLRTLGKCTGHLGVIESLLKRLPPQHLDHLFRFMDERELFERFDDFLNNANHSGSDDAVKLWNFLSTSETNADPVRYLYEEMELVRSAFPAFDQYSGYLENYERPGRSIGFHRNRREQVLRMLHAWEQHQLDQGFLDHMGLSQAALVAVEDRGGVPGIFKYRCVLVDEFQDFSTLDLEILLKVPAETQNGLFLTGDLAQKIYAKELDFPKAQLGPQRRVVRSIRKNYRNSKQILLAADSLIRAFPPSMDGDPDLKILDPELASRTSAKPIAVQCKEPILEAWRQASEWLADGNPGFSVCIATANPTKIPISGILGRVPDGITAVPLSGDYLLNAMEVVVSDMAAIKGFEFSLIIILGLEDGIFPYEKRPEAEIWRDAMRLYVAITRGRDEVRFPYSQKPSRFLSAMADNVDWRKGSRPEDSKAQPLPPVMPPPAALRKEEKTTYFANEKHPSEKARPAQAGETVRRHKIVFLNGYPCLSVPRGLSERELSKIIDWDQTELALNIQREGWFSNPNARLPDHIVRGVLENHRILVSFFGD